MPTNMNIENHSFGNYIPENAEILFIGTFPTHSRNRDFEFFYPNSNNIFWKIISQLLNHDFQYRLGDDAVNERKQIASKNRLAFTDMLAKAIREKDNSGDEQLIKIELTNVLAILKSCPTIHRIILTSRSGNINALKLFQEHLTKEANIVKGVFEYQQRKIKVFVPYSPSPRVERQYGFNTIKDMYQKCFEI
jgi:hypoxanthine-DNA glycosylase